MPNQVYRFRVRTADDLADTLVLTSIRSGTNPYIVAPPSGDGQEVDLLTGGVRTGAYVVEVADAVTGSTAIGTLRVVTSQLNDGVSEFLLLENGDKLLLESGDPIEMEQNNADFGRPHLLSRKAFVEMSTDNGATWTVWIAGFLSSIRQVDAIRYAFTVSNTRRVEQTKQVFTWQTAAERTAFPQRGCVFGGPIIGGLGGGATRTIDSGGWEFLYQGTTGTSSPVADDVLALKYDRGYFPPTFERRDVPGVNQRRQFWAAMEPHLAVVPGDASASGAAFSYLRSEEVYAAPELTIIVTDPDTGDEWLGSLRATRLGPNVDNRTENAWEFATNQSIWVQLYSSETAWPTLPATNTRLRVRAVTRELTDASPLYLQAHPVDIAADLYALANLPVDSTSVTTVKNALGPTMMFTARLTASVNMAEFLDQSLFGPFGFAPRYNTDGEIEFFTTRVLSASAPTLTIADADIVGDTPPAIYDLDEGTVVTGFTITQESLRVVSTQDGPFSKRPSDGILHVTQTLPYVSGDTSTYSTRIVEYTLPGMVTDAAGFVPTFEAFAQSIAREGFDRFGRGGVVSEVQVLRSSAAAAAQIGEFVYLNAGYYPNKNYRIGESTVGPRVAQIVRREERPEGPMFKLVDAGVYVQPAIAPTISIAASSSNPRRVASFTITNAATLLNAADIGVAVEYAVSATTPAGGITFARYAPTEIPLGAVELPAVQPGSRVWVRARSEQAGVFPSAWTAWADVTLTAWVLPTVGGTPVTSITNQTATVTWGLAGNTTDTIDIYVAPGSLAPADWTTYRVNTLPAGTTSITLTGLTASTAYIVGIAFRDAVSGVAGVPTTATFSTGSSTVGTANVPAGLAIIDGVNDVTLPQGVALALWASVGASKIVIDRADNVVVGAIDVPGTYSTIATVPANTETYIDPLPVTGAKYWYRIRHQTDGQALSDPIPQREIVTGGYGVVSGLKAVATGIPVSVTRPTAAAVTVTPESFFDDGSQQVLVRLNYTDPQARVVYYEYRTRERTKTTWSAWTAWSGAVYPRIDLTYMQAEVQLISATKVYQVEWRVYAADGEGNLSFLRTGTTEWPQNYGTNKPIIKITKQGYNASTGKYEVFWRYFFDRGNNTLDEDGEDNTEQVFTTQVVAASVKDQAGTTATNVSTGGSKVGGSWKATWDSTPQQAWTYEISVDTALPSTYYLQYQDTDYVDEQLIAPTSGQTFSAPARATDAGYIYAGDYGVEDNPSNTNATYVANQTAALQAVMDIAAAQGRVLYCGGLRIKVNGPLYLTGPGIFFDSTRNDDGPGLYVLTNGVAGTGYTVLTTCASYGPVVKGSILNTYDVKIQADPSLAGRVVANGVRFYNPQISTIQNIRVLQMNGFGCEIDEVFDSTIETISVQECGNASNYAVTIAASSGTSNETHVLRLQAELCYERIIYIDMLAGVIDKIHAERANITKEPGDAGYAPGWVLTGARTHYNEGRFDASGPLCAPGTAKDGWMQMYGEHVVYTAFMSEPTVKQELDGGVDTPIVLIAPNFPLYTQIRDPNTGRIQVVSGSMAELYVQVDNTTAVTTFLAQGTNFGTVTFGFMGNPPNREQVVFENCTVGVLRASSTLGSATFRGCTIQDWQTGSSYYGYAYVFENECLIAASGTISMQGGLIIRDSRITANVEVGGGSTILARNLMIVGNLTQLGSPPTHACLFDGACTVTGTITGFDAAPGAGPSITVKQPSNYWHRNQRHYNLQAADGSAMSWVCTVAGSPGTWVSEGTLSADGVLLLE